MADGKIGIFTAFWRYISFYNLRKGRQIADAADAQFTGSVRGIKAGYDMHADKLVERYHDLLDGYVIDNADMAEVVSIDARVTLAQTLMRTMEDRESLARTVLDAAAVLRRRTGKR